MKKYILLIIVSTLAWTLAAQDGITLHFMRLNPYSDYYNPSMHLQYNGYVGIPGISHVNAALTNTSARYKNIYVSNNNGNININLNNFVSKLSNKKNMLNTNVAVNIIDFGFRTKPIRFSFSYRIRMDEYCSYNKDLVALPVHGNMSYLGPDNPARPELRLSMNAYQEFALGMQVDINSCLYLGFRPKLLFGIANIKTRNANATLYTDPEDYTLTMNYGIEYYTSTAIPYSIGINHDGDLDINFETENIMNNLGKSFKNMGAALDLGMTYRINNMFGVAASVLDLGFIRWNHNCKRTYGTVNEANPNYHDGNLVFNGILQDVMEQYSGESESALDVVHKFFPIEKTNIKSYTSVLAARFLVEGYCNLGKHHRLSALFQGRIVNKQFIPSFTVAWNGNFLNYFDLCVSYTVAKRSYTNLGLGVGFNLKIFHLYVVTDNIFGFINSKSIQRAILNANNANVQVGLVFDWGQTQEKRIERKTRRNFEVIPE